jgi:hypothetical protein
VAKSVALLTKRFAKCLILVVGRAGLEPATRPL